MAIKSMSDFRGRRQGLSLRCGVLRLRVLFSDLLYALRKRGRGCSRACSEMHTFEPPCELAIR